MPPRWASHTIIYSNCTITFNNVNKLTTTNGANVNACYLCDNTRPYKLKIFKKIKKHELSIAGLRCEFGGHLPISSKKCPRPIQVVLGGSYAFQMNSQSFPNQICGSRSIRYKVIGVNVVLECDENRPILASFWQCMGLFTGN